MGLYRSSGRWAYIEVAEDAWCECMFPFILIMPCVAGGILQLHIDIAVRAPVTTYYGALLAASRVSR